MGAKTWASNGLYDRVESEFHYLQGDPKAKVLVSISFVYGRHSNVIIPWQMWNESTAWKKKFCGPSRCPLLF